MGLTQEDIEFIKSHLVDWLADQGVSKPPVVYEIELRARILRVEEELKHQRELMMQGFKRMDERFEAVDQRFEAVDKRFEAVDKRFEAVDKRFEAMDKRFEAMQAQMDKRFEDRGRRLDRFMIWSFSTTLTVGGLVVAALKLWP